MLRKVFIFFLRKLLFWKKFFNFLCSGDPNIESSDAMYNYQYDQGGEDYSDYNYDDEEEELKDTADSSVIITQKL